MKLDRDAQERHGGMVLEERLADINPLDIPPGPERLCQWQ